MAARSEPDQPLGVVDPSTIPRTPEEYRAWWEENTDVPYGYCWCGCGRKTGTAPVTNVGEHYFEGEPYRYVRGRWGGPIPDGVEAYKREWREKRPEIPYGYCWCGCGQKTNIATKTVLKHRWYKGEPKRFLRGHAARFLHNLPTMEEYRGWWEKNTDVPYGYCWCGCGRKTGISKVTKAGKRYFKGEPHRYVRGHAPPTHPREPHRYVGGHEQRPRPSEIEAYKQEWREKRPEIPYGYCWCGCGQKTSIATKTVRRLKWFKGEPKRWVRGHQNAVRPVASS